MCFIFWYLYLFSAIEDVLTLKGALEIQSLLLLLDLFGYLQSVLVLNLKEKRSLVNPTVPTFPSKVSRVCFFIAAGIARLVVLLVCYPV